MSVSKEKQDKEQTKQELLNCINQKNLRRFFWWEEPVTSDDYPDCDVI